MEEINKPMYFGATPPIFENAKLLRQKMTYSENVLWEKLKGKQICGVRFRRQHPIDSFIVDFYCHAALLAIELDGEIHNYQKVYDKGRSEEIEKFGIKIIRFVNKEIESNLEHVVHIINESVKNRLSSKM